MRLLVFGAEGQLGFELCRIVKPEGIEVLGTTRHEADVTKFSQVGLARVRSAVAVRILEDDAQDTRRRLRRFGLRACGLGQGAERQDQNRSERNSKPGKGGASDVETAGRPRLPGAILSARAPRLYR